MTPSRGAPAGRGRPTSRLGAAAAPSVLVVAVGADTMPGRPPTPPALELPWWTAPAAAGGAVVEANPPDGAAAVAALAHLVRSGTGAVGVGCGPGPVAPSADRAAGRSDADSDRGRGDSESVPAQAAPPAPAYAAARVALGAARRAHQGIAVRASRGRGRVALPAKSVEDAETCLWVLADLWRRRSREGWAVADLMDQGHTGRDCAGLLDISPSAVSQRASAARYVEGRRLAGLAARHLDALLRA